MHVHAVAKQASSYEHIDPQSVGNERRVLVSELSGRSNVIALATKHDLAHDRNLLDRVLGKVVALENEGYQFEAAEASFDLLVKRTANTYTPHFRLLNYHVNVESDDAARNTTEATVKIEVGGEICHESWSGLA